MLKSYSKITFRNILKHRGYSLINLSGLAIGMAVCILIFLWVRDELNFDRSHKNADQIHRVITNFLQSDGGVLQAAVTPWPLGQALKKDYPEVVDFTRYDGLGRILMTYKEGDKSFYESKIYVTDPSFLRIFSFPFLKGDPATALSEDYSVVITEKIAKKYFGKENPMGKTLTFINRLHFAVTGVIKNIPSNSTLKFDVLLPFEPTLRNSPHRGSWHHNDYYTFLLLKKDASAEALGEKIYGYLARIYPNNITKFKLQALTDMHLHSHYAADLDGVSKDKSIYVYILSLIAFCILLIACINFINLTIARASARAKEVGLRKVVGARRKDLIAQFFGESIFLTIISFIFALILVYLLLPLFNNLTGKELTLESFRDIGVAPGLLLIAIITGMIAGIYPAVIQSSFRPAAVIKGNLTFSIGKPRSAFFKKVLVVFQFTLSVVLIICTLIVNKQLGYIQARELGYEKNHLIYFTKRANLRQQFGAFKEELQKNPNVLAVTASSDVPTYTDNATYYVSWEGKNPERNFLIHQFLVDHDYLKTFGMEIVEGRGFSKDITTDAAGTAYILNEAAVKAMEMNDPVGKKFNLQGKEGAVIGVVKDFHYKSLHNQIEPLVLKITPERSWYIFVKLRSENISGTLNYIKKAHQKFSPQYPLEYHFIDDQLDRLYDNDKKTLKIFQYFTFIAIFISCLGLFGLAAFTAQLRTREIGIRKVVGASISNIILMLSKEFLILVGTANILAWPLAYFAMNKWLQGFAYRTTIVLGTFFFSAILAIFIAICTVIYQSIKAAIANPVDSIRCE